VFHTNPAGTFQVRVSRRCTLEDIAIYSSPAMCFRLTGTEGVTLRRVRIVCKPGTDRLMASASDGMHCKDNKTGPVIEDCQFEALLDDSVNLSTMSEDVLERLSATEFLTGYSDIAYYDSSVEAGDTLLVYDPVRSVVIGEATAAEVEFVRSHRRRIMLARSVEGIADAKSVGRERATKFYVKKTAPAVVRRCTFRSQMKTALLLRVPVVCEGNVVQDSAYGVHVSNSFKFGEGPLPHDQVIRDNRFRDCWIAAVQLSRLGGARRLEPAGGPIRIEGNTILQGNGRGIGAHNFRGLTLRDNTITIRPEAEAGLRAITLENCADVVVEGNVIEDSREDIQGAIRIRRCKRDAVRLDRNTFRLPDGVPELDATWER
jgi:hypothetical protein